MFDSQWIGLKYNYGIEDEVDSEKYKVLICKDSLVRSTCTWNKVVC